MDHQKETLNRPEKQTRLRLFKKDQEPEQWGGGSGHRPAADQIPSFFFFILNDFRSRAAEVKVICAVFDTSPS